LSEIFLPVLLPGSHDPRSRPKNSPNNRRYSSLVKLADKYIGIRILRSDKDLIDQEPGASIHEKMSSFLSRGKPGDGSANIPPCGELLQSVASDPAKAEIASGPFSDLRFEKLEDCKMLDSKRMRCLRYGPKKTYRIDFEICESCQFRGRHYPQRLGGVTERENVKAQRQLEVLEQRKAIEQMKLDQEIEKTNRKPTQVIWQT
jgi:hypothetical protein